MVRFSSQSAFLSLLLPFAILCNLGICEMKASCSEKDKQILLCFKHGLTDPSDMLSTWSNKEDCCKWRGVQCDITGRVNNLSLPCSTDDFITGINKNKTQCLTGEFHLSLFELEFLNYLDLSNNNFESIHLSLDCHNLSLVNTHHGSRNFSNLAYLDLSENENLVIDDLRWLVRLPSLEYLNLNFIDLHKQTQWLQIMTMFPSLSELHLSSCMLESINPSLEYANFTSLEFLDLSSNDFFSRLPNWLFNLSGLLNITLEGNRFNGHLPNTLLNLRNLHSLNLGDNMLSGTIPDWLGQLQSLNTLSLDGNSFIGYIPTTLGNMSSLTDFSVVLNNLTGSLPESLGQLSNLKALRVADNFLSGVVSHKNFAKLSKLQTLWLGSPSFIFDFDLHWIPPFQLQRLVLEYADLQLIPWLYTQTSLSSLKIGNSSFTTIFPDKFWSWAADLFSLSLYDNSMLNWDMSNVLLNSEIILLKRNGLTGGLPQLTSNVSVLQMRGNSLSGPLSPLLCHNMNGESNLQFLDISDNHLSGGLTDCWVNWKSLVHIDLTNNNLTGMIPHSMGTLSNLLALHLSNNRLHGEIPVSLKSLQKLVALNLAQNKFSGSIPSWIGQDVKFLQLRSNEFSGDIPLQVCKLYSLMALDLADNRLTGAIPHCLNDITTMVFKNALESDTFGIIILPSGITFEIVVPFVVKGSDLKYFNSLHLVDFSRNLLSGKIPLEVFMLSELQSLNLSLNHLMGTIPEEVGNMEQLESLDFSNNKLSGEIPQNMSALSFLDDLNLSFNNLWGQIPLGTQLQSFTGLSYEGNPELCGAPLIKKCYNDEALGDPKLMGNDENGSELFEGLYMGMGVGFAISFWVVCCSIFYIGTWRHAYFKFLGDVKDQLYVKMILKCTPSVET